MNLAQLSLEQAPPLSIPLRFLLTAPLFLLAAGLLLLLYGDLILLSRWHPATSALTHLMTLGVITMVMVGALTQMFPVIAASPLPGIRWLGPLLHLLLVSGTLLLVSGLLAPYSAPLLQLASGVLALAITLLLLATTRALLRVRRHAPATYGIAGALLALAITLLLGLLLTLALSGTWVISGNLRYLTTLHYGWGIGGWIGCLIIAVAYQVIPMFYVTPDFPRPLTIFMIPLLLLLLLLWSLWPTPWLLYGLFALFTLIAVVAWRLLGQRRRHNRDPSLLFWRSALLLLPLLLLLEPLTDGIGWSRGQSELAIGVVLLFGIVLPILCGMLLRIVPFLCWFHLHHQQLTSGRFTHPLPSMKELLPDRLAHLLFGNQLLLLTALLLAIHHPASVPLAGLLLTLQGGLLFAILAQAVLRFRHEQKRVAESQI